MSVIKKFEEARDLFECSICRSEYNDPRLLTCNHSFCLACIQKWSEQRTNKSRRIVCPTCKAITPISETNPVEKLPPDFKVNSIIKAFGDVAVSSELKRSESTEGRWCDFCPNGEAVACCINCKKQLCGECQTKHERHQLFQSHSIEYFNDAKEDSDMKCDIHESEPMKYFCKTCNKVVCTLCALGDHEDHDTGSLTEGFEQCKKSLNGLLQPLSVRKRMIQGALREAQDIEHEIEKTLIRSNELIERKTDTMVAEVQEWESKLKKSLKEQFEKCKQKQVQYVHDLKDTTEAINSLFRDIATSIEKSSENQLMSNYSSTISQFKALTSNEPEELEMTIPCFNDNINLTDFLNQNESIGEKEVRISDYEDYELPQQKMQWKVTERSSEIGGIVSPVSVSFSPKQDILVSEVDNNRVQIFDSTGKSTAIIKFKGTRDALWHPNGQIYMVNAEYPGVIVCDEQGTQIDHWGMDILPSPRSVAANKNGDIIIADKRTTIISVHTQNGELRFSSDAEILECPVSVCTDSNNRIIVADRKLNLIQIFSKDCRRLFSIAPDLIYQNHEAIEVAGVCTDLNDHIYVVLHESQKIVKYSPRGQYMSDVLTQHDGLAWPTGIAASPGGLLAVVESKVSKTHSALKLFKMY